MFMLHVYFTLTIDTVNIILITVSYMCATDYLGTLTGCAYFTN